MGQWRRPGGSPLQRHLPALFWPITRRSSLAFVTVALNACRRQGSGSRAIVLTRGCENARSLDCTPLAALDVVPLGMTGLMWEILVVPRCEESSLLVGVKNFGCSVVSEILAVGASKSAADPLRLSNRKRRAQARVCEWAPVKVYTAAA